MSNFLNLLFFLFLLIPSAAISAEEAGSAPINIVADSMEAETKANKVKFKGNVTAQQKDMTITANELTAVYAEGGKELNEVLAVGNVRITQQDKIAIAENAQFLNKERKIILTGNPKVWQGKDVITGDKIIYFLDDGRTEVIGRVKGTIHPKKEETFANPTGKGTD